MPHLTYIRTRTPCTSHQGGFTLIELLVAMLLGLITVLVVAQVMLMAESRKRTTTSGSDATVNGAMALYTIERDAKNAGYGMTASPDALGCAIKTYLDGTTGALSLAPVVITQGTDGKPDTLEFLASDKDGLALPIKVTDKHNEKDAQFQVDSRLGLAVDDLLVAIPPTPITSSTWCSLFQVTDLPGNSSNVIHNSGKSLYNPPGGSTIFPPNGYPKGSSLINLGAFSKRKYSIEESSTKNDHGLTLTTFNVATPKTPTTRLLYPQIIQLQAEYGLDPAETSTPTQVVQVTSWTTTTPTTPEGWRAVKAIRVAVVSRSDVYEKDIVTISATDAECTNAAGRPARAVCWAGGAINKLNGSNPAADDWQHYRYRVLEAVIPIRNVIWHQ